MNSLTVKFKISGNTLKAELYGEIDHHSVKPIREEIDKRLTEISPEILAIEMKNIGFMDSSGLGLILGRYEKCKAVGVQLKILNPSDGVQKVLRLAGTEKIIAVEYTENNSLAREKV